MFHNHWTTILLLVLGTSTIALGCSDDGNSTTTSSSGSSGSGGSGGGSSSSSSSSSSSGAGGEGGAGGGMNAGPGQSIHAVVNSGDVAKSDNYRMVFTLGQSSPLQTNIKSQNYRLKGGLIAGMSDAK